MNSFVQQIIDFLRRPEEEAEAPEDACPNCWGHYEYDGKIREGLKSRDLDLQSGQATYNFIEEFVVTHVDGIRLPQDSARRTCPRCGKAP